MFSKIIRLAVSDDPIVNLVKFIILFVCLILFTIFMSNASTSQDWEWHKKGFDDLPSRIVIYHDGQQTKLMPGQPGFDDLAEAIRASLAAGVDTQSNTGLSDVSREEAYTRYRSVEAFFDHPVKLHAWFFTGHPTQMLFPITGRHSDWPIVFLGRGGEYFSNAPVLKTKEPILQVLKSLGYLN
ncbi:MAG: hypothetical protein FJ030_00245 [Chloroflexi bacterium]|nr:hypothetical protein [Chloroflexota bacterium]